VTSLASSSDAQGGIQAVLREIIQGQDEGIVADAVHHPLAQGGLAGSQPCWAQGHDVMRGELVRGQRGASVWLEGQ